MSNIDKWDIYNNAREWGVFVYNREKAVEIAKALIKDNQWYGRDINKKGSEMIPSIDDIDGRLKLNELKAHLFFTVL